MREIGKLGIILFLIAAVCSGLLAMVNGVTVPVIAQQTELAKQEALKMLIAEADNFIPVGKVENENIVELYVGQKDDVYVGSVAKVMPAGYGGAIELFVGVDTEGEMTGIQVVSHSETPGLGANMTEEKFKNQFMGQKAPLDVVKGDAGEGEISAITGATITTVAVTEGVNEAVNYIEEHKDALMKEGK